MPSCSRFFGNNANKIALTEFLSSYYLMQGTTVPETKKLFLAGGFIDGTLVKEVHASGVTGILSFQRGSTI